jgi:NADH dehydrogenase
MSPLAPALPVTEAQAPSALEGLEPPHPLCGTGRIRVVILGAGYGGITAALRLARRLKGCARAGGAAELVLVDRHPHHLLKTRLHEAAVAGEEVAVSIEDLIRGLRIRFVRGEVGGIDLGRRRVVTSAGEIGYDVLVIAMGAQPAYRGVPGLREHARTLRSRSDALALRNHLARRSEEARRSTDPNTRARLRRIVIAGGGFSGVELAAELSDQTVAPEGADAGELVLLEAGDRLLPGAGPLLSRWATAQLGRRGVSIRTRTQLVRAEDGMAHLSTGERIEAGTLVWMGGVQVSEILQRIGAPTGRLGRLLVDETLQVVGAPGVYAIGDAALATDPASGREVPLTARFAAREGRYVGDAIAARLQGAWVAPYRPGVRGDAYNMERYLGLASLAFGGRGRRRVSRVTSGLLKRLPSARHLLRLRSERAAWRIAGRG